MKRISIGFIGLLITASLFSCGEADGEDKNAGVTEVKVDLSSNPYYKKGLALVAENGCLSCHQINDVSTGPAYATIAAKYVDADDATIEKLADHIINGGSGVWGEIPMIPHPNVSVEDAKQMVKYVLLLNK